MTLETLEKQDKNFAVDVLGEETVKVEYDEFGFVKRVLCPICGGDSLEFTHKDDVGTEWFKCLSCGAKTSKTKNLEKTKLKESLEKTEDEEEGKVFYIGNGKLQVIDDDVFLFVSGKLRDCFKASSLNSFVTKKRLANILGLEADHVSRAIAQFLFKLKTNPKKMEKCEEAENIVLDDDTETRINIEVERIKEAENQLEALKSHLENLIVGEERNKQAILVLLVGSKFSDVDKKQIIILKGTEGGGKTTLASILTSFFKTKEVGRFTEHALEYSDLKGYEVLFIKELGSMDMDKQGVATIKYLSCDDKGFVVEFTVRDEDGRFRTEQKRIPAITTISTTTRLLLDSQFERRAWLFNVDESSEQTERVKKWKALLGRQKDEVKLGLRKITDYDFSKLVLKRFFEHLEPKKIIIPFRETIAELLPKNVLRVRGDIDKVYTFIELYALLNLKRLKQVKEHVYAVTSEVAIEALQLIQNPLNNMLGGTDERLKPFFKALRELKDVEDKFSEDGTVREELVEYTKAGAIIDKKARERLAKIIGKSERTIQRYLEFLEAKGYVSSDDKKPKSYTLLYALDEIEEKLGKLDISEMSKDLHDKMEKEAQKWLQNLFDNKLLGEENKIESLFSNEQALSLITSEVEQKQECLGKPSENDTPPLQNTMSDYGKTCFQDSFDEKSLENRTNEECPKCQGDRNQRTLGLYQCELCAKQGKPSYYASRYDLEHHIEAYHKMDE